MIKSSGPKAPHPCSAKRPPADIGYYELVIGPRFRLGINSSLHAGGIKLKARLEFWISKLFRSYLRMDLPQAWIIQDPGIGLFEYRQFLRLRPLHCRRSHGV